MRGSSHASERVAPTPYTQTIVRPARIVQNPPLCLRLRLSGSRLPLVFLFLLPRTSNEIIKSLRTGERLTRPPPLLKLAPIIEIQTDSPRVSLGPDGIGQPLRYPVATNRGKREK